MFTTVFPAQNTLLCQFLHVRPIKQHEYDNDERKNTTVFLVGSNLFCHIQQDTTCNAHENMLECLQLVTFPHKFNMAHETAFLGASTVLGRYWTKRRPFDYLINKDNFHQTFGKSFRMMVYLDSAIANGPENVKKDTCH